jgi:hypothetical protein
VTFGLTLALLFLPAMILINAVVDPDFLSKLRVSFVTLSLDFFFSFQLMQVQGGSQIGAEFRVRLE